MFRVRARVIVVTRRTLAMNPHGLTKIMASFAVIVVLVDNFDNDIYCHLTKESRAHAGPVGKQGTGLRSAQKEKD